MKDDSISYIRNFRIKWHSEKEFFAIYSCHFSYRYTQFKPQNVCLPFI